MKKLLLSSLLIFVFTGFYQLNAQKDLIRENFFDAEFFLSEEEYKEALYSFQKVFNAGYQENSNINYRMGICYLNIPGQKNKSIPYLEKAVKNISENYKEGVYTETTAPADALLYMGNAYRINNQLDKAIDSYNSYLKASTKLSTVDLEFTKQQIESCNRAKEAMKNPAPIYKENLGKSYNSSMNNFQGIYSGDNNSMAYMTAQKFYDAAFFVKKINGTWSNPMNITPQIESDGNQYVSALSFDGTKLYLVRINNFDGDIMVSDYSGGRWNPSKPIGKPINTKFFESHCSISPDGNTLYFTSNRTGGQGGMDIYTSTLSKTGEWSEPVNLGKTINTPLNEETPFICGDGKTLYFSSQGHSNIGGYDVFTSELQADNNWSQPKALPYPVNTTDDELFFYPDLQKNGGYLTLYEADGFGDGDLYHIKIISPEEALDAVKKPVTAEVPVVAEVVNKTATEEKPVVKEPVATIKSPVVSSVKYQIKPVFFGFDSYVLTDAAKEKLSDIVKALKDYPKLSLEIRGYTDAMGSYEYNQRLSEKRAKAVTDFIVNNGIDAIRLKTTGFSESENVAINAFPDGRDALEGRKYNRRVEFRIIELGGALLLIEEIPVPETLKVK
jgi:outer membrane protein OmpA-like peptidoglycan-associated protein/Tol biopolymer transport system component